MNPKIYINSIHLVWKKPNSENMYMCSPKIFSSIYPNELQTDEDTFPCPKEDDIGIEERNVELEKYHNQEHMEHIN